MSKQGDSMKYLSLAFFFMSAYSMDPMEAPQRNKKRSEKYNLFIEVMRDLERESRDFDNAYLNIWPPTLVILKGRYITVKEPNDYVILDSKDFE